MCMCCDINYAINSSSDSNQGLPSAVARLRDRTSVSSINRVAEIAVRATSICDHERTTTIQETVDPSMGQRRDRTVGLRLELGSAELGLWIKI